jgi:hypothetical protein
MTSPPRVYRYDQEHTPLAPEVLGLHLLAAHSKGTPGLV